MFLTADSAVKQIDEAIADAKARFQHERFQVLSWPQTWGSTACGFGGIAGQAFTDAQTVIVSGDDDAVIVYHRGRFAYEVRSPSEDFWVACGQRRLPGAARWEEEAAKYDREFKGKPKPKARPSK